MMFWAAVLVIKSAQVAEDDLTAPELGARRAQGCLWGCGMPKALESTRDPHIGIPMGIPRSGLLPLSSTARMDGQTTAISTHSRKEKSHCLDEKKKIKIKK